MVIAQIIRRTQLIEQNVPDPFPISGFNYNNNSTISPELFREFDLQAHQNHALLRLVYILEQGLDSKMSPRSAIEWALERDSSMIENLKEAIMGNYQVVNALIAVLDSGNFSKKMLDEVIDQSDAVINLREDILMNRIKQAKITQASAGLQRYFSLICFTCYINESPDTQFEQTFSSWLRNKREIWTMLQNIRKKTPKLYLFRPVEDLHKLVSGSSVASSRKKRGFYGPGMFDMSSTASSLASEMEEIILKSRTGVVLTSQTILKVDFWSSSQSLDSEEHNQLQKLPTPGDTTATSDSGEQAIRPQRHHVFIVQGGSNFRRIKHTHVYGIAQPTVDGLRTVIRKLLTDGTRKNEKIQWINLREEPIIYINGIPYVLRDRYFTLRNMKVYQGINGGRLEQLEERLKQDVIREVLNYDGRILLHGEDKEGNVLAAWEEVDVNDVMTVREVMHAVAQEISEEFDSSDSDSTGGMVIIKKRDVLDYHRVPITAEKAPEWCDFDDIRSLISSADLSKTALIM
jgi:hypothetical protein